MSKAMLTIAVCLFVTACNSALAEERTTAAFKKYVNKRTAGRLGDDQLNEIVRLVDKNDDGKISDKEFADRIAAFQRVATSQRPERSPKRTQAAKESSDSSIETAPVVEVARFTDSPTATVLLITGDELAKSWIPFAKWKTANGKLTKIITVGQIDRDYKAKSIQEKFRLCVRKHIENHGTKWVILGGDSLRGGRGVVPGGHLTVHAQERKGIPTDIVFLSETNWDADGDGIYGEFEDDRAAITYPDGSVGLGRIPLRTAADVAAFTAKVIAYESRYPTSNFAKQMIYTCTDQPAYPKVRNSWDGYLSKVWNGEMGRFFSKETPWDEENNPGSYPLSAENLVDLFNKKSTSKLHIHGHGHLPAWVLERSSFTSKHIGQLKNDGAYPLITTVSCNTGEYDSTSDPSIVEHMLRIPNAGSVAVVAPIRTGKPHFAKRSDFRLMVTEGKLDGTTMTMTRYWTFGLGDGATTGHALMKAKNAMADDARNAAGYHLCICELNLLGDPTLDMRAQPARKPKLKIDVAQVENKSSIEVATDAPGSTVCLWNGKSVYHVAVADKDGDATFSIAPSTGDISVTVAGANLNSTSQKVSLAK